MTLPKHHRFSQLFGQVGLFRTAWQCFYLHFEIAGVEKCATLEKVFRLAHTARPGLAGQHIAA